MPYQPVINELGPKLIASGYDNAAAYQMQGAENVAGNISTAASAIGGGVGKARLSQQEIQQLGGKVSAMKSAGFIGEDDVAKFNAASLSAKRGMVGEWDAHANILSQKDLDTFKTNNDMRRDTNMIGAQGASAATLAQLKSGTEPPKYDRVTLADGTVAFVAPGGAPTTYPTDGKGKRLKAQQPAANPLAALFTGQPGAAPAAPVVAPAPAGSAGGYQVGRKYSGMTYLGGDPNDAASWQQ